MVEIFKEYLKNSRVKNVGAILAIAGLIYFGASAYKLCQEIKINAQRLKLNKKKLGQQ